MLYCDVGRSLALALADAGQVKCPQLQTAVAGILPCSTVASLHEQQNVNSGITSRSLSLSFAGSRSLAVTHRPRLATMSPVFENSPAAHPRNVQANFFPRVGRIFRSYTNSAGANSMMIEGPVSPCSTSSNAEAIVVRYCP
jgi:hypothetical protein